MNHSFVKLVDAMNNLRLTVPYQTRFTTIVMLALLAGCNFENIRELPTPPNKALVAFEEIPLTGGTDTRWMKQFHPFIGATPIDIDGDGAMEIFVGSGYNQKDALYQYQDGELRNIIHQTKLSSTQNAHGANSIDIDNDGDVDLFVARSKGLFLYLNDGSGHFSSRKIPLALQPHSTPLNVALGDIDRDGDADLYVSVFVDYKNFKSATFNDPSHAKANILLRNDGRLQFTDITSVAGVAAKQNTFTSSFIDLNNDKWQDLIVSQNTGQVEIYKNEGNGTFSRQPFGNSWGYWMSLTPGDVDKDGDQDLFFSNTASTIPAFLLNAVDDRNDDQSANYDWMLMRNDGDFVFNEVTKNYQLDGYGFGWGGAFEDLSLNGEFELLVAQNYIKWPGHKFNKMSGKSFVLYKNSYYQADALNLGNPNFGQSPLILDINNDGRPDVFWINMEGVGRAYLNRSSNHFLTLVFPDNTESLGAKAVLKTKAGSSYTRVIQNNTGMSTDPMTMLTFGLGKNLPALQSMEIEWLDGSKEVIDFPPIDQIIHISHPR